MWGGKVKKKKGKVGKREEVRPRKEEVNGGFVGGQGGGRIATFYVLGMIHNHY